MISRLILDIETIPDNDLDIELRPGVALGNLKDEVKIEAKKTEWEENGQIKAMSVSPFMNKIISIQAWSTKSDRFIDFREGTSETNKLEYLMELIDMHDLIIGHNIIGFDLPTSKVRAMICEVPLSAKFKEIRRYSDWPFYDTMQMLAGWDRDKWKGLDWWCKRLGIKGKSNQGSNVYQMWQEGKQGEIDEYCRDDVRATKELYERIKDYC